MTLMGGRGPELNFRINCIHCLFSYTYSTNFNHFRKWGVEAETIPILLLMSDEER